MSLVLFVMRRGRLSREEKISSEFMMKFLCGVSPISALVLTHCEVEGDREALLREFRTDQCSADIAKFMQKGIYAVGFPDLSRMKPRMRPVFEEDMAADAETLRDLVFRSTDMLPTNDIFSETWKAKLECNIQ